MVVFCFVCSSMYLSIFRLQNSPYFCVFKYARAVKQKVSNKPENRERDWGETLKIRFFFLSPHTRVRLLRHALPISLVILRKKPTVLQSRRFYVCSTRILTYFPSVITVVFKKGNVQVCRCISMLTSV